MNKILRKGIRDAIKNKRDYQIIQLRLKGIKLDDVGEEFDITRERVRQLELRGKNNVVDYIESILNKKEFNKYIKNKYIDANKVKKDIGDELWSIILYSYKTKKKNKKTKLEYSDILDTLVLFDTNEFSEDFNDMFNKIETTLTKDIISIMKRELAKNGYKLPENIILDGLKAIGQQEYGEFLLRQNANIGESIRNEIKYNYKNGVKVSSEEQISELRDVIEEKYNHVGIKNKNVIARIQQSLYLWDASTYTHEDNMYVEDDLKDDILDYIYSMFDNDISRISYKKLYNIFKDDIEKYTNFINYNSLHGWLLMLHDLEEENYICIKFYVCKTGTEDLKSKDYFIKVADYLKDKPNGASASEIAKNIPGFDKTLIRYTTMYYPEVVKWGKTHYMNLNAINVSDKDKQLMLEIISRLMDNEFNYTSKYILFDEYKENYPELLKKINVNCDKNKLFDLNKHLFNDRFAFNPPHIVAKDMALEKGFTSEDFAKLLIKKGYAKTLNQASKKTIKIYKNNISLKDLKK